MVYQVFLHTLDVLMDAVCSRLSSVSKILALPYLHIVIDCLQFWRCCTQLLLRCSRPHPWLLTTLITHTFTFHILMACWSWFSLAQVQDLIVYVLAFFVVIHLRSMWWFKTYVHATTNQFLNCYAWYTSSALPKPLRTSRPNTFL
jgi:hypothetical protein